MAATVQAKPAPNGTMVEISCPVGVVNSVVFFLSLPIQINMASREGVGLCAGRTISLRCMVTLDQATPPSWSTSILRFPNNLFLIRALPLIVDSHPQVRVERGWGNTVERQPPADAVAVTRGGA